MAKRTPRSSADDSGAVPAPAQPKPRRQRASAAPSAVQADTIAADPRVEGQENEGQETRENNSTGIPSEAGDDAPLESMSMGSEPTEQDIRMRAYHRYLERGGAQGTDFEDWLEAERELRGQRN